MRISDWSSDVCSSDLPTGQWTARLYVGPQASPVAEMPFSVEDFVPERLDLELTAATPAIAAGETVPVAVSGRFLFGAPAADLAVTAEVVVGVDPQPFPDWADYRFGLATEEWTAIRAALRSEEHQSELQSLMR